MSCKVAVELRKEMNEADMARREEMPNATKPLDQEVGSGWNPQSYKEKSEAYETAKAIYRNHKKSCIECQV